MSPAAKDKIKVLIIDDDQVNLELLQAVLEAAGYDVMSRADAISGIETARQEQPHIILMDVQLPETDGLEATRMLKADVATEKIPVVAVTAHVRPDDRQRCMDVGCILHLGKPIDTRQLPEVIARIVRGTSEATS
jgi:CheY-like chemotaxis protein